MVWAIFLLLLRSIVQFVFTGSVFSLCYEQFFSFCYGRCFSLCYWHFISLCHGQFFSLCYGRPGKPQGEARSEGPGRTQVGEHDTIGSWKGEPRGHLGGARSPATVGGCVNISTSDPGRTPVRPRP